MLYNNLFFTLFTVLAAGAALPSTKAALESIDSDV
jgi:hypothetical protein